MLTLDWGSEPDGIKAHALDVVQLALKTLERAAAVATKATTGITTTVVRITGDTVREDKVDVARLPGRGISGEGCRGQRGGEESSVEELHGYRVEVQTFVFDDDDSGDCE